MTSAQESRAAQKKYLYRDSIANARHQKERARNYTTPEALEYFGPAEAARLAQSARDMMRFWARLAVHHYGRGPVRLQWMPASQSPVPNPQS